MKKSIFFLLALFLMSISSSYAQKFGYCNSTELLVNLPEVKQADSELQGFQSQLQKMGQDRVKQLQANSEALKRKEEQGAMSPKDLEIQTAALAKEEESIVAYEQEVYQKISEKRQLLYQPILEKVNKAMADVATENGFAFVFDTNSNILLYADETLDVSPLVKKKLNIE